MTVEQTLFTTLTTDSDVSPLILNATSPKTWRLSQNLAAENTAKPFVVYTLIDAIVPVVFNDVIDKENARLQIDVYATTPTAARTLGDHITDAINTGMVLTEITATASYEHETKLHRFSLDLTVWH